MADEEHEILDRLLADGPLVMFWTKVHGPPTDANPDEQRADFDYVSPSMQKVFGHPRESVNGPVEWMSLIHPDDRPEVSAIRERAIATNGWPTRSVYRIRHADGGWRWAESNVNFIEGPPDRLVGFVTDVTEQHQLVMAKEQADRANVAKSEFLSRMSHELRTPLNSILGFGQLLEMSNLSADDRASVDQILRGGKHLLSLINEVLDIARIESGHLTLSIEPVDIRRVITDSIALIAPSALEAMMTVTTDIPEGAGYLRADRQRTIQVLLNLLSNAVKYNDPGGHIVVGVRVVSDDKVRVSVTDDGHGIPPEDHDTVFEAFERLEADRSKVEGTGVGLALTKQLVGLMGGEVGIESTAGEGTTFWFELARTEGDGSTAPPESVGSNGTAGPEGTEDSGVVATVLCIEDNPANLQLVQRILKYRPGVRMIRAMTGHVGLALAVDRRPDLILLDLHLPDLNGIEILRELRADERTTGIRTLILSADATDSQRARARDAGADGYLTKPIDVQELLAAVDGVTPDGSTRLNS